MHDEHAVVVGGGFAGLLTAEILTRHFAKVTLLERDRLPDGPESRAGVPQARHIHGLLVRGWRILDELLPSLRGDLLRAGAHVLDVMNDIVRLGPSGWCPRGRSSYVTVACSRALLEWSIRRQVLQNPRVRVVDGFDAAGLLFDVRSGVVRGVRHRSERGRDVVADWVVDATGRRSRAPEWLAELGYAPVEETCVNSYAGYASRCYEPPPNLRRDWKALLVGSRAPALPRAGALSPLEGNRWIVTLSGAARDYPPTDERGFLEFARTLAHPILHDVLVRSKPLSRIAGYQQNESRLRHYERMRRMPARFLILADAACALNPVYGQGMTAAALAAQLLDRSFADAGTGERRDWVGFELRFQKRLARSNAALWTMATAEDYRYPETRGRRRTAWTRMTHAYLDRIFSLAAQREDVYGQLLQVGHLLKKPRALARPDIALLALLAGPMAVSPPSPLVNAVLSFE
jgi:2-polyprenyl-6-methoxyphenol hydroxylase-like FAD-dependent oxidoreductase